MKKIPAIKSVMTAFPFWIDIQESMKNAERMMLEHDISHLPVKDQGEITAVIAMSDIDQAKSERFSTDEIEKLLVKDVCVMNPYMVDIEEPLDNVVLHLSNYHIGSALVMKNNRLAGVFTVNDACRCFANYLREQFRPGGGDEVA